MSNHRGDCPHHRRRSYSRRSPSFLLLLLLVATWTCSLSLLVGVVTCTRVDEKNINNNNNNRINKDDTTTFSVSSSSSSSPRGGGAVSSTTTSAAAVFPTEDDKRFMRWLADNGATFSGSKGVYSFVDVGSDDDDDDDDGGGGGGGGGSRGMFAKDNVTNGDVVFTAPMRVALLVPSHRAGPMLNRLAGINPEWALAALLIRETRLVRLITSTQPNKRPAPPRHVSRLTSLSLSPRGACLPRSLCFFLTIIEHKGR